MTVSALADAYRALVCDLDGVVYRGRDAVPHAVQALAERGRTMGLVFATNNASRSAADVAAQLTGLGLETSERQVVTSAEAGAAHLAGHLDRGAAVLAVGGPGVTDALTAVGLTPQRTSVGAVAVLQGYGAGVTAADLAEASYAIQGGATWVATNRDATLPTDRGTAPGNGALVDAVVVATGQEPFVVGKPHPPLYELAVSRLGVPATDVLAVGDRLDTDVLGAMTAGLDSLWVLTGVDDLESFVWSAGQPLPTFVGADLRVLSGPLCPVVEVDGWWTCGEARVRIDADANGQRTAQLSPPGAGRPAHAVRNALLSAGVHALAALRDTEGADLQALAVVARDLAARLI